MNHEKIQFPGHSGDLLAARLDAPRTKPRAYALFAHCFTCSKDLMATRRIASRLASKGVGVVRFDFTGLGHSGGEFGNTSFSSNVDDLVAAANWMRENLAAPELLIGHSLGGAAVIAAASEVPEVRAVATIGAPHDPEHVVHNFAGQLDEIARNGVADVVLAGRTFQISSKFVEDVSGYQLDQKLAKLGRALLVLHAPTDNTVGIESASRIFISAKHPKSFVTLDNADHLLSKPADADYAADVISAWSERYLSPPKASEENSKAEDVVRVAEVEDKKFLQDVTAGDLHLFADEPAAVGGDGQGFTPYQLLGAGLGACTSMTIRMYARRKKWPLDSVNVEVKHDKVHSLDCDGCEEGGAKVDVFSRVITLTGDLDEEQIARLMQIADRCPVHRSLESSIRVETHRADAVAAVS